MRQGLLNLVEKAQARGHRIDDLQGLADVGFGAADERAHQRTDVENERRPARFGTKGLGKGRFAGPRNAEQKRSSRPPQQITMTLVSHCSQAVFFIWTPLGYAPSDNSSILTKRYVESH